VIVSACRSCKGMASVYSHIKRSCRSRPHRAVAAEKVNALSRILVPALSEAGSSFSSPSHFVLSQIRAVWTQGAGTVAPVFFGVGHILSTCFAGSAGTVETDAADAADPASDSDQSSGRPCCSGAVVDFHSSGKATLTLARRLTMRIISAD